MQGHQFIFSPGHWIGEGRINFNISSESLHFYTRWMIEKEQEGQIRSHQQIEIRGSLDSVQNHFLFSSLKPESFNIELSNELFQTILGKGVIDAKTIAWEFRGSEFEGFEVYELQENGDYMIHGEYISLDQLRTVVDGRIWKKG